MMMMMIMILIATIRSEVQGKSCKSTGNNHALTYSCSRGGTKEHRSSAEGLPLALNPHYNEGTHCRFQDEFGLPDLHSGSICRGACKGTGSQVSAWFLSTISGRVLGV